ncbi:MAG: B12-binding domain-containing radical SAM protein [Acidobacteria bacterium]|nr:B12-binding domain-containing radical SAM protein [Acidobacteriota bacterium]
MIDVLLTHSYHLYYDRKQVRKMQPYPPLGTIYAAALLRQRGFSVAVFDSMLEDPEREFPQAIARYRPRIVAIYEDNFNFLSKMCLSRMRQAAYGMIEIARAAGATVVVNGSDSSDHREDYLRQGAAFVLLGEAEWTLLELVEALAGGSGREAPDISGLAFLREPKDEVFLTPARPLMRDLDSLPAPARDLVDIQRYRDAWKSAHGFFSLNLVASRGCPYRCNWCAKPIYGDSFHARSAESVAAEISDLKRTFEADHLWFADDIFGLPSRWVAALAEHVERRDASVPFKMQSRVDLMKEPTVAALRRAGCAEVWMGVESGAQKILDAMEKGTRVEQVLDASRLLRHYGIRACYFLQFGYSGETWADILKTVDLVRHTRPDDIGISVSYPLPGTKFYERVREQLGEKTHWVDSEDLSMMFKGAYTSEFYRALHDALHAEVETWSPPGFWKYDLRHPENASSCSDLNRVRGLWEKVERLEKTCRNADPTLLPALSCSAAGPG